jgi:hypothetical protein
MSVERYAAVMKILDDQNHLSERADGKAISLLSTLGIFTVFFVSQIGSMKNMSTFMDVAVVIYFISVLLAIIQIIMAISPRIRAVKHTLNAKPIPQPTFFGGIAKFPDAEEYKKCLDDVVKNDEELTEIYIKQIYQVAQINATKYACVNRAVWFVVLALGSQLAIIAWIFASR